MTSKNHPDKDYTSDPLTRRELLRRGLALGAVTATTGYIALAPEQLPWSRLDSTGLRGLPQPQPFTLPDFSIMRPANAADVGLGRNGTLMEKLRKSLDAVGGITHYIKPNDVVLVKPNVAFDRSPQLGATTNPDILEALIKLLLVDCRAAEVRVADNPIESPADCFAKSGVRLASERSGARVYLPDSNAFQTLHTPGAKLIEQWAFFQRPFRNVTKVIGIAPVKDHNLCHASMGVKNWYGLLGGRRNQFHQDIHEIISDLSIMIKPTLTILDGTHVLMANGPTGGDPANVKNADVVLTGVMLLPWTLGHLSIY